MACLLRPFVLFVNVLLGTLLLTDCRSRSQGDKPTEQTPARRADVKPAEAYNQAGDTRHSTDYQSKETGRARRQVNQIPPNVLDVLAYVRANGRPIAGYVGGRRFGNFEHHLPRSDADGRSIQYQEWDVNPRVRGRNRGTERLVTGSDGRAWYTRDHYNSFVEIK